MTFHVEPSEKPCSRCGQPRAQGYHSYCRICRNQYAREHRPKRREMTEEARRRANCRSYTKTLIARGTLIPQPCEDCGAMKVQAHHDDYSKPRQVRWKCKNCHRRHHREHGAIPGVTRPYEPVPRKAAQHPLDPLPCSKCGKQRRHGSRYCHECHRVYMKDWRAKQKEMLATMEQHLRELQADEGKSVMRDAAPSVTR